MQKVVILLLMALLVLSCSSSQSSESATKGDPSLIHTIEGNGARELGGYFFANRTSSTVDVIFVEPFLFIPEVNLSNPSLEYSAHNVSEWGFTLSLDGVGFWKDSTFRVNGNKAKEIDFCRDSDGGNDTFFGGVVYSSSGTISDTCIGDDKKILQEASCAGTKPTTEFVECEFNCYDSRGPAFCVNDENVKDACDDQIPGTDFFKRDFVTYNGIRHYDYCIAEIHGSRKQLLEYTCEGAELSEVNNFCTYGCSEGRCLYEDEFTDPDSLDLVFYAFSNSSNIDESILLQAVATDTFLLQSLHFYEDNGTDRMQLTWESCQDEDGDFTPSCTASWKVKRLEEGWRTFSVRAYNAKNLTIEKNLTLNFSGDPYPPGLEFNISPALNQVNNFTNVYAYATDVKGIDYMAVYRQVDEARWDLLESTDCEERLNCSIDFRMNSTIPGKVQYLLKARDINGNSGFEFASAFYEGGNVSLDVDPPVMNFSASVENATISESVIFTFEATDEQISSVNFYKKEPDFPWIFISSLDCGNDIKECTGEFAYENTIPGTVEYVLNVTDAAGNSAARNLSIEYSTLEDENNTDAEGPNVTMNVVNVDDGVNNYTSVEYSATDDNKVTYMNLYIKSGDKYELLRTKFCFRQESCESSYRHTRLVRNTTFLVAAADSNGNRGELEQEWEFTS